jgi:hypothetical protein
MLLAHHAWMLLLNHLEQHTNAAQRLAAVSAAQLLHQAAADVAQSMHLCHGAAPLGLLLLTLAAVAPASCRH